MQLARGKLQQPLNVQSQLVRERETARQRHRELEVLLDDADDARSALSDQVVFSARVTVQVAVLKGEVRRLERNAGRSSAHLEYLKNILVKYLQRATPLSRSLRSERS